MSQYSQEYLQVTNKIASITNTCADDWFLVFKARYGMQSVFDCIHELYPDCLVATQMFTCCTAVDPILQAGLKPLYIDINKDNFALDFSLIENPKVKCEVLQNTFGIVDDAYAQRMVADAHDCQRVVVEDCAHSVLRLARDLNGKPLCDVSIHSFGVEKFFAHTFFGGAVWVNPDMQNTKLYDLIVSCLSNLDVIDNRISRAVRNYHNQLRILNRLPAKLSRSLRDKWIRTGKFECAIVDCERNGALPYKPMAPDSWICNTISTHLDNYDELRGVREDCVGTYREVFGDTEHNLELSSLQMTGDIQPYIRFACVFGDADKADRAIESAWEKGFYLVPWYRPLLYPGVENKQAYFIENEVEYWPEINHISKGIVCLPTDIDSQRARQLALLMCEISK